MEGWIKLHRKMLEWEWYDYPNVKALFIHCLLKANHKPKTWRTVQIEAGEFITSVDKLAKETGLTPSQVRTCLSHLKSSNDIDLAKSQQGYYTVISILSWDKYQDKSQSDDKPLADRSQTVSKPLANTKEGKNDKEGKKIPPISPTGESSEPTNYDLKNQDHLKIIFDDLTTDQIAMAVSLTKAEMRPALLYWIDDRVEKHREFDTLAAHRAGFRRYLRNSKDKWKKRNTPHA